MQKIQKIIAITFSMALMLISTPADVSATHATVYKASAAQELKSGRDYFEALNSIIDETVFPDNYPEFLKQVYILLRQSEHLEEFTDYEREVFLKTQEKGPENFYRRILEDEKLNVKLLYTFAREQAGQDAFETFLKRFGIDHTNREEIELEVLAQINRMRRREAYNDFIQRFNNTSHRMQLVKESTAPRELAYALRHCEEAEFEALRDIVLAKDGFGPQTSQDKDMLGYLERNRRAALAEGNKETAMKWRTVIAQLVSQRAGRDYDRLPFSKCELFAMMRNAERTLEQRKQPFINITRIAELDKESASYASEIIKMLGAGAKSSQSQRVIAYCFFDSDLASELEKLTQVYEDILSNKESGQAEKALRSIRQKKQLLEILDKVVPKRVGSQLQTPYVMLSKLAQKILENRDEPHRLPFIRGIILLNGDEGQLVYRFIEDLPMIVAGATYSYQ